MKLTAEQVAVVAETIELIEKHPLKDDLWDSAKRRGPHLHEMLAQWLKEQL